MTSQVNWNRSFLYSLGLHSFVILSFIVSGLILKNSSSSNLEIIRASVRVDVVGMPKLTIKELRQIQDLPRIENEDSKTIKEIKSAEEIKIKPNDVVEEVKSKEKTKPKKLMSFLQKASEINVVKKTQAGQDAGDKAGTEGLKLEGNQISSGSALVGDFHTGPNSPFAQYVQKIPDIVRQNWRLPSYLIDQNLKCRIKLFLSQRGDILKLDLYESSGNDDFDKRAMASIRASAPFPQLEDDVAKILSQRGVVLGFPL